MATGLSDRTSRSLLPVTLAFASGIGAASRVAFPPATMLVAAATLAAILLWCHLSSRPRLASLLLLPFFFLTGLWHGAPAFRPPQDTHHIARLIGEEQRDVVLAGVLAEVPATNGDRTRLLMAVSELRLPAGATPAHGLVQLTVGGSLNQQLLPGDQFLARARIGPHRSYRVPGAMDYRIFLQQQGIWLTGWAETPLHIVPLPQNQPLPWHKRLRFLPERLRAQTNLLIGQLAPAGATPLYLGLLTGTRTTIPPAVIEQFKATGATHLLAISGMNLGLVTLLFTGLATWLLKRSTWVLLHLPAKKIALLLALPPLLGYAGITGLQPPAVRSLIMVLVFMAAIFLDRQWCSLNNLAIAALLILLLDPTSLTGASFQLSFAATAAIILAYRLRFPLLLATPEKSWPRRSRAWLANGLAISIVATLTTAPLCLLYFNQISLLSPITTLLLTPLLCFWAIPLGLLGLALAAPLPALASHLFALGGWGIAASLAMAEKLATFPWASFYLPTPTLLEVSVSLATLLALLAWQHGKTTRLIALALATVLIASPLIRYTIRLTDQSSRITFLDVGQGNAVVVEMPGGKTVLIDGGGLETERFNVGERLIAPFLWRRGIGNLDGVIISHPHTDHWNGLPFIIAQFRPATLWINGDREGEADYAGLLAKAEALGITVKIPQAGEVLFQSGATTLSNLTNLHLRPAAVKTRKGKTKRQPDANNQSLVLQLRHHRHACLLPGDIDAAHEKILMQQGKIASTVLLAPHHGSKNSSSPQFIAAVKPRTIVVSAQGGGKARFPHPEKRKMWQEMGIPVLITGREGTIKATLGEDHVQVAPLGD